MENERIKRVLDSAIPQCNCSRNMPYLDWTHEGTCPLYVRPTMANVAVAEFDSPQAKDDFIRGLAATARAGGNVRDYILDGADPKNVN